MALIPEAGPTYAAQRVLAQPEQQDAAPAGAFDEGAAQLGQIGAGLTDIGVDELRQKRYQDHLAQLQARADAAAAVVDHQGQTKQLAQDLGERLVSGDLSYQDASQAFSDASKLIDVPTIDNLTGPAAEAYQKGISKNLQEASLQVSKASFGAQTKQFGSTVDQIVDFLGKQAGMSNGNMDEISARLDSMDGLGRAAKGAGWDKYKQSAKDVMWNSAVNQQFNASYDSLDGLTAIKKNLQGSDDATNPGLAMKLDSPARNTLISKIDTRMQTLQNKQQSDADRMDAIGASAIKEAQNQSGTGVPASDAQIASWQDQTRGTQYAALLPTYLKQIADVQHLLVQSPEDQQAEVQRQQAYVDQHGADTELQARVKRTAETVNANIKSMETQPVVWTQNRTQTPAVPMDFSGLQTPDGIATVSQEMQRRLGTIAAMQTKYGPQIATAPLLPQEADALKSILMKSSDTQKVQLFGMMSKVMPTDAYQGLMTQIKADPATTFAGIAAGRGLQTLMGYGVAETLLLGNSILKDKTADMPKLKGSATPGEDDALQPYFDQNVGDSLAPGDPERAARFQIFRAAYAGAATHNGTLSGTIDDGTARGALNIATGGIADIGGGHKVLKPWGMTDNDFADKTDAALRMQAPTTAFGYDDLKKLRLAGTGTEGQYFVLTGKKFVPTKDGKPLLININANSPGAVRGGGNPAPDVTGIVAP